MAKNKLNYDIVPEEFQDNNNRSVKNIGLKLNAEEIEMLDGIMKHYCINTYSQFFKNCLHQVHTKIKSRKASGS
jgi:hypothetical protein